MTGKARGKKLAQCVCMSDPFYITTPIYYVNDEPHLGHAYTTVLADVLTRFAKLRGSETFFLTGTDEHGQKVQHAAEIRGIEPQQHADDMVERFRSLWQRLHIQYDDFIRTTEIRHSAVVQEILQKLWEDDQIYKGTYEGWYCVPDERFWTEKDVVDGLCPDCSRPVEQVVENNYFFRMGHYQDWLVAHIREHPTFIRPETRRNEVLGFLRQPLGDLCISRPKSRLSWGIPLPFDEGYVTYVWFDALLNYVTAPGYLTNHDRFERYWPRVLHLIGKDILITHCVYWPTMLRAAGIAAPHSIFAHGWWVLGGTKMSKSLGNVVKPMDLVDIYGVDAFRYFLMRDMVLGKDASFSEQRLLTRYRSDLSNDLGNLSHRITKMIERYFNGAMPRPTQETSLDNSLQQKSLELVPLVLEQTGRLDLDQALAEIMLTVREINGYLEQRSPWNLAKLGQVDEMRTVLYTAAEALRLVSVLLWPVMPERMELLWRHLGWEAPDSLDKALVWGELESGSLVSGGAPLFPRDIDR